jgi:hypothetical protein
VKITQTSKGDMSLSEWNSLTTSCKMTSNANEHIDPVLPTAMPSFENRGVLSEDQMTTFMAIAEAVLPGVVPDTAELESGQINIPLEEYRTILEQITTLLGSQNEEAIRWMLSESGSRIPGFRSYIERIFNVYMGEVINNDVKLVLNTLK